MKPADLLTLTAIATVTAPLAAASATEAIVTVRTYNYAQVSEEDVVRARNEATRIFRNAGIALEWVVCRVPGNSIGAACTEQFVEGHDFMLRLTEDTREPETAPRQRALGASILDRDRRTGVLMTLDMSPIRTIAARSSNDMPTLLGRAIAHEVGHLLLGTAEHADTGLMRAFWSHDELRGAKPAHWGFSSREAARMREGLTARRGATN
jgi:hypothetical protein